MALFTKVELLYPPVPVLFRNAGGSSDHSLVKPQHAYCPNCGHRQHSILKILRHDFQNYRHHLLFGSALILVALFIRRRPMHPPQKACPAKLDLSMPSIDIGKTAQSWSNWAVSWIPGTQK
uniref:Transposase n=1 Tax=Bursaphelenchus xylophilus TaxID=6326 RepID=A0A1I7S8L4_BURXY